MFGYIYEFVNKKNGKRYVGQTIRKPKTRFKEHVRAALKELDNFPIHSAIRKYGIENFEFNIIETIKKDNKKDLIDILNELEIFYIKKFNTLVPNGYNINKGGGNYVKAAKEKEYKIYNDLVFIPFFESKAEPRELYLYCCIKAFSENENDVSIPLEVLSKYSNISIPTIRKLIKKMEKNNLITINKDNKTTTYIFNKHKCYYRINISKIKELDLSITTKSFIIAIFPYFKESEIKLDELKTFNDLEIYYD